MRRKLTRILCLLGAAVLLSTLGAVSFAQPAAAAADPSFRVTCFPRGMAPNDPIVFPGQAGASHMHSFFGAKGVDQNTTLESLLRQSTSQCGNHYDTVDLSAYWIPTLYKNGQAVHVETGEHQLQAYYQRAGGPDGAPVAQAMPQGLKMIAGDMHATTPQSIVTYVCAKTNDTGQQRGGGHEFLSCAGDETLVAKLVFPDCWDGKNLDSANHRSHMAYSGGSRATCPSTHPVKIPRITFEAWYHGVNGSASSFSWASGGPYTFHGDVISAWDTHAAANLVNQCINVAYDCNPHSYPNIPRGNVTAAQIAAQIVTTSNPAPAPAPSTPAPSTPGGNGHGTPPAPTQPGTTQPGTTPGPTQPGTTQPGTAEPGTTQPGTKPGTTKPGNSKPSTAPSAEPSPTHSHGHHHGATPTPSTVPTGPGEAVASPKPGSPAASWITAGIGALFAGLMGWSVVRSILRRRRR